MPSWISLTNRDAEILSCLSLKVRVFSVSQIARTWWADSANSEANARARLKRLEEEGLVQRFTMLAHPEIEITSPTAVWERGGQVPNFGQVSWALKSRWAKPPTLTLFVIASKLAGNYFGGKGGRHPRPTEWTHDLHMSGVFLRFRKHHPDLISYWLSEDTIRKEIGGRGVKIPDALIRTKNFERVIEFGGAYGKNKLKDFHAFCEGRGLAYEIW